MGGVRERARACTVSTCILPGLSCITCVGNCQYLKWIFRTESLAPLVWHSAATVGHRQKKKGITIIIKVKKK